MADAEGYVGEPCPDVIRQLSGHEHGSVLSTGAPEGDGEIREIPLEKGPDMRIDNSSHVLPELLD